MSYYPESESHIRDKVKEILDLSNYVTKKELNDATYFDTSNLAAKSGFIALKSDGKLKTNPIDLKKLSDAVDKKVVKNTKYKSK